MKRAATGRYAESSIGGETVRALVPAPLPPTLELPHGACQGVARGRDVLDYDPERSAAIACSTEGLPLPNYSNTLREPQASMPLDLYAVQGHLD